MLFQPNHESDVSMESPDAESADLNESIDDTDAGLHDVTDGNYEPLRNNNDSNS